MVIKKSAISAVKKAPAKGKPGSFFDMIKTSSSATATRRTPSLRPAQKRRRRTPLKFDKNLVFVGMSFKGKEMEDAYLAIKDICKGFKLKARRVDENKSSGFIILEIVDLIEKAEFIIFDLTHERPNVYYELGYAHGVGNSPTNVLLVAKEGTELHFDIAALRVRFYKSTEDLRRVVKENLAVMKKESRSE
jgi:hypothetical protein